MYLSALQIRALQILSASEGLVTANTFRALGVHGSTMNGLKKRGLVALVQASRVVSDGKTPPKCSRIFVAWVYQLRDPGARALADVLAYTTGRDALREGLTP